MGFDRRYVRSSCPSTVLRDPVRGQPATTKRSIALVSTHLRRAVDRHSQRGRVNPPDPPFVTRSEGKPHQGSEASRSSRTATRSRSPLATGPDRSYVRSSCPFFALRDPVRAHTPRAQNRTGSRRARRSGAAARTLFATGRYFRNATVTPSPPSFGSPGRKFVIARCPCRCARTAVRSAPVPCPWMMKIVSRDASKLSSRN